MCIPGKDVGEVRRHRADAEHGRERAEHGEQEQMQILMQNGES